MNRLSGADAARKIVHDPRFRSLVENGRPIPLILGAFVNGLGLARSFGEEGIPSIVLDVNFNPAFLSKYASGFLCPHPINDEEAFFSFLHELASGLPVKLFVLMTNDIWLIPVSRREQELQERFILPMSEWATIERCLDKAQLHQAALDADIPVPGTHTLDGIAAVREIEADIRYPCILKPAITVGFLEALGSNGRTLVIDSPDELKHWAERIENAGLGNVPLILQERIPGGAETLYTLTAYSNREGEIIAYSTGHKIRQYPPDAGTILSGHVVPTPAIVDMGQKLIKALKFHGISNTEFKLDSRDGIFKLIEINPRPGMWNYSVKASGINLPFLAYREALGERLEPQEGRPEELIWLDTWADLGNAVYQFRRKGYPEHALSFAAWRASIRGRKVDAIFSWQDPMPAFFRLIRPFRRLLKR